MLIPAARRNITRAVIGIAVAVVLTFSLVIAQQPPPRQDGAQPSGGGFPIPNFSNNRERQQLADELRAAQNTLREHYCKRPADSVPIQERANWNGKRDQLLQGMIIAEEKLVWECGGYFTREEHDMLHPVFLDFGRMRDLLQQAAKIDNKIAELLVEAEKAQAMYQNLASDSRSAAVIMYFCYLRLAEAVNTNQKLTDELKTTFSTAQKKAHKIISEVIQSIRHRGLTEINRQLAPQVFKLHRPKPPKDREAVETLLLKEMYKLMVGSPIVHPAQGSYVPSADEAGMYTPFDDNEIQLLLGEQREGCSPSTSKGEISAPPPALTITAFDSSVWPRADADLGVADFVIEDFEDGALAQGLRVELSDSTDAFGPTDSLPTVFDPTVNDPNSERVFTPGVWDGSRALLNRRTPPPSGYTDLIWSDVTFHVPGGASSFGFSLQSMDLDAELFVNSVSQGSLSSHLSAGGGRNGYLRIDAGPGEAITLVKVANGAGDGLAFDHVAFNPLRRSR